MENPMIERQADEDAMVDGWPLYVNGEPVYLEEGTVDIDLDKMAADPNHDPVLLAELVAKWEKGIAV